MKNNNIVWLILIVLVLLFPEFGTAAYFENFDDGKADKWQEVAGDWKVDGGEYIQQEAAAQGGGEARNRASGYAVGDSSWTDYTFEVRIKPVSSSNYAGVMFRVGKLDPGGDGNTFNNGSQYYYWLIGIGGNYSKMWQAPACKVLEETAGDTLTANKWSDVKVEMYGQNAKLYLNGKKQKDFDFSNDVQIESGGIALASYNASIIFDEVKVQGAGLGMFVNSKDKLAVSWGKIRRK